MEVKVVERIQKHNSNIGNWLKITNLKVEK